MIVGIGTDLCDIKRIERMVKLYQYRFIHRIFTQNEHEQAQQKQHKIYARYAQYFSLKEAFVKALGTGIGDGISWQDIEICYHKTGQPYICCYKRALLLLQQQVQPYDYDIHCSVSDEQHMVNAVVVISKKINLI